MAEGRIYGHLEEARYDTEHGVTFVMQPNESLIRREIHLPSGVWYQGNRSQERMDEIVRGDLEGATAWIEEEKSGDGKKQERITTWTNRAEEKTYAMPVA